MEIKKEIGKLDWAFSAGRIPSRSTGREPEFISHDKIAVLNTSDEKVKVKIFIFFEDAPPVGPFEIAVRPRRLRKIKFNDLIDPVALQLDRNYSCLLQASLPVVVQFSRMNTAGSTIEEISSMAFSGTT